MSTENANMSLVQNGVIDPVKEYNKRTLEELVMGASMKPAEISEWFGNDASGKPLVSASRIYADMRKWGLNVKFLDATNLLDALDQQLSRLIATITTYTQGDARASYRKIEEVIKRRLEMSEVIAKKVDDGEVDEEVMDTVNKFIDDDISLGEIVKFQQKDQEIVIKYEGLLQTTISQIREVRAQVLKEIDMEALLLIIYRELMRIDENVSAHMRQVDPKYVATFAQSFYLTVKTKMYEVIGNQKMVAVAAKKIAKEAKKLPVGKAKTKQEKEKSAATKSEKMSQYKRETEALAKKHGVHFQVIVQAQKLAKEHTGVAFERLVDLAVPIAASKYKYLNDKGQFKGSKK